MRKTQIGLVSDTHGKFAGQLSEILAGVEEIWHAGDICGSEILHKLEEIASVLAISGNCDVGYDTSREPEWRVLKLGRFKGLMVHSVGRPDRLEKSSRELIEVQKPHFVVSGHSHKAHFECAGGRVYMNPGSAGPRRFKLAKTAARINLEDHKIHWQLYDLEVLRILEEKELSLPKI